MANQRDLNLDSARGLAAILIFFYHFGLFGITESFWIYVNFFFVLSGFVLYEQIILVKNNSKLSLFIKARAMRIFPLFIFIFFIRIILDIINRTVSGLPVNSFIELFNLKYISIAFALLQNFSQKSTQIFFPAWSLSTEWLTYLIISIGFYVLRNKIIPLVILYGSLMLFIGFKIDIIYINQFGFNYGVGAIGQGILGFGIGMSIKKNTKILNKFTIKYPISIIIAINVLLNILVYKVKSDSYLILLANIIFAVTLILITKLDLNQKMIGIKRSMGQLSYGIYLWHTVIISVYSNLFPLIERVTLFFICSITTFVCASLTFMIVEKPFLSLSRKYSTKLKL